MLTEVWTYSRPTVSNFANHENRERDKLISASFLPNFISACPKIRQNERHSVYIYEIFKESHERVP